MTLHHTKHHQTYVNGLNAAEEAYAKTESPKDRIKLQAALKFNGGGTSITTSDPRSELRLTNVGSVGHINHTLFWKNLAPAANGGGNLADGAFKAALERDFGSVEGTFQFPKLPLGFRHKNIQHSTSCSFQDQNEQHHSCYSGFRLGMARLQPRDQEARDRHHCQPGSSLDPRPYHWYRYLGTRFLLAIQECQA